MGVGIPEFFHARECETGGWQLYGHGSDTPQGSRDPLGSVFRLRAKEAGDAGGEGARRTWTAAALRMDREVVEEGPGWWYGGGACAPCLSPSAMRWRGCAPLSLSPAAFLISCPWPS